MTRCLCLREVGGGVGGLAVPTGTTQLHRGGGATPVGVAPQELWVVVVGGVGVV